MPNKFALCVGINNYPGTVNDLSGCVNDANDWAALLSAKGFTVKKLLNSKATRVGMLTAIKATIAQAVSGDMVLFTYSGHGSNVPDKNGDEADGLDECLCPYDIDTKGAIIDDELHDIYSKKANGVKLVIVSDSCHSGSVAKFATISTPPTIRGKNAPRRKVRYLPPGTFLSKREMAHYGSRTMVRASVPGRKAGLLMAACQDAEYSYDAIFNNRPNGAFTYVALSTFKKLKSTASFDDWYKAIKKVLPSPQYPQSPNLDGTPGMKKWKIFL